MSQNSNTTALFLMGYMLKVKVIAGKNVITGVNEGYKEMKERYEIEAIVGDADRSQLL